MATFRQALVRPLAQNFSAGLTTADLGLPFYKTALRQHKAYCEALESCGVALSRLPPDDRYPDSPFVEDTAILTPRGAIITRPGAESRRGEIDSIESELRKLFDSVGHIEPPGTLDGGDVCEAGNHFLIGISVRTNEDGARQLAQILQRHEYSSEFIDIRHVQTILHLKSGISYLGENRMVAIDELATLDQLNKYDLIRVAPGEEYAANCIRVNDSVLIAAGFPSFGETLDRCGYKTIALEMSEFQKMDGGLSCLSLRF